VLKKDPFQFSVLLICSESLFTKWISEKKPFFVIIIISEETLLLLIGRVRSLSVHFTGIYSEALFKMFKKKLSR